MAVREQIEEAVALIASQPNASPRALNIKLTGVRRVYLAKIRFTFITTC